VVALGVNNNDRFNLNANNDIGNNRPAFGIASLSRTLLFMKTYKNLFSQLISIENLENAYWKARKHKSRTQAVREFEKHWQMHLAVLHKELKNKNYTPKPLKTFILRDPKTRKICVSDFRDRIVHHALVNVLQPIFEPRFINDSYASMKGKGTLAAIKRFRRFFYKVTSNGKIISGNRNANAVQGYALKADIRHYFDTVDHKTLLVIIQKRVKDRNVIWLTRTILCNYDSGICGKGMPLGNWTSQFFANVYLNELDQFVKHELKAKYYLRYVDDFAILHGSKRTLEIYEQKIKEFLRTLKLELHPDKCKIMPLSSGVSLLGYRVFHKHLLPRQRNIRKIWGKLRTMLEQYEYRRTNAQDINDVLQGWNAYSMHANAYGLRQQLATFVDAHIS
jgi:RNA-directed DNA polymerase